MHHEHPAQAGRTAKHRRVWTPGRELGPLQAAERRLIVHVLAIGTACGLATLAAVFLMSGVVGLYVVFAICVLVGAAAAQGVGA